MRWAPGKHIHPIRSTGTLINSPPSIRKLSKPNKSYILYGSRSPSNSSFRKNCIQESESRRNLHSNSGPLLRYPFQASWVEKKASGQVASPCLHWPPGESQLSSCASLGHPHDAPRATRPPHLCPETRHLPAIPKNSPMLLNQFVFPPLNVTLSRTKTISCS